MLILNILNLLFFCFVFVQKLRFILLPYFFDGFEVSRIHAMEYLVKIWEVHVEESMQEIKSLKMEAKVPFGSDLSGSLWR